MTAAVRCSFGKIVWRRANHRPNGVREPKRYGDIPRRAWVPCEPILYARNIWRFRCATHLVDNRQSEAGAHESFFVPSGVISGALRLQLSKTLLPNHTFNAWRDRADNFVRRRSARVAGIDRGLFPGTADKTMSSGGRVSLVAMADITN